MTGSAHHTDALSEADIERYARQIIVPGVGEAGQLRLCSTTVLVDGNVDGARAAASYLNAAGLYVCDDATSRTRVDCVLLADFPTLPSERLRALVAAAPLAAWYAFVDGRLTGGLADASHPIPAVGSHRAPLSAPWTAVAHRIAGADAAATVIAAVLLWVRPGQSYEIALF